MGFLRANKFVLGIVIGLCVPVMAYGILLTLFDFLDAWLFSAYAGFTPTFRTRTLGLIAICCNLIPFHVYRKMRHEHTMRGLIIPTMLYVGFWLYLFAGLLFKS